MSQMPPNALPHPNSFMHNIVLNWLYPCLFQFDSLRPSQQFFSYVGTGLPVLNQY